jgi:hypothetical protein
MTPEAKSTNAKDQESSIDRMAPAGSPNSLGAESVRDGRPGTDDSVVEAMDEQTPGVAPLPPHQDRPRQ